MNQHVPSEPARLTGAASSFDFGEEGNNLVEVVNDPMLFNATREAGNTGGNIYWGKDFLLVSVDDADDPVSVDLRPGKYNAEQLAAELSAQSTKPMAMIARCKFVLTLMINLQLICLP